MQNIYCNYTEALETKSPTRMEIVPKNQTKMANTCAVRRLNQILSTREIKIKAKNSTRLEKMAHNGVKVAKKVIKMSNSQALNNVEDL